jgi:hypothetical protein
MNTHSNHTLRELDHRVSDGIDVRLLWRPSDNGTVVTVSDARTGGSFTLEVRADQRALDVFHHPYAYAPDAVLTRPAGGELTPAGS